MNRPQSHQRAAQKAVVYCRVSSKKQRIEGSGLDSQEHRCREFAREKGYTVEAVFPDDVSGGGDFMKRPGMVALLGYLDARPTENLIVIFDDLKRFARDTEFHLALRRALSKRGASVECPNFKFEDTPEGKFVETIFAAQGELERVQNGRQVLQKMRARIESGYWCFHAPVGYKYVTSKHGGKILVPDEPLASVVREALEGYATGRFASQTELRRFLEANPFFPSDKPNGEIRPQTIVRFLGKFVYAGYVAAPEWGIPLREGRHEGLISKAVFERIQQRLNEGVYAPTRKDIKADFPLRGAVCCAECETPLTAGWCKGKYQKYAYYFCREKGCSLYGKSIARKQIEGDFRELLSAMRPTRKLLEIAGTMFRDAWTCRAEQAQESLRSLLAQTREIDRQVQKYVDLALEAGNPTMLAACEKRIAELEKERLLAEERARNIGSSRYSFDQLFELCARFLSSPCKIWDSGRIELQRLVLRLTFSEHLFYCRENGFRTPKTTLPFRALSGFSGGVLGDGAARED